MKEALLNMNGDKKIKTNFNARVLNTNFINDLDFIELDIEENNCIFKNITLIKGEIFPLPKKDDILNVKQLYLNYDKYLTLRLFINAEICLSLINNIVTINNDEYNFSYNKINESLKKLCCIQKDLYSNIFKLESFNEEYSYLFCSSDSNKFKISNNLIDSSKKDNFFLITNYVLNNNEILFENITFIQKLNEEKLFQNFYRYNDKMSLFKVIDIEDSYYICVDSNKNLYKIEKNKELEIKLCQLLIVNYKLNEDSKTFINNIKLDKKSIIKVSEQEIFFSNLISINQFSVIYIKFLDYKKNNLFDKIIIDEKELQINHDEIYYVFPIMNIDFDYFPINISLLKSNNTNTRKNFKFILYKGVLNKINAFINYDSNKTYCLEYFFMSIDIPLKEINTEINIEINNIQYDLKYFDTFQSVNRKRINLLNVPFQEIENFNEKKLENINSIQICKIFYQNKSIVYGIFDINEMDSKEEKFDNSYLDNYYSEFGDVISLFEEQNLNKDELIKICLKKFNESKIDKTKDLIISTFNNELTLSQYKTRIGLLLCYYIYLKKYKIREIKSSLGYIKSVVDDSKLTLLQRLRIIIFYLDKKLNNIGSINNIIFISDLLKNSPYVLADEFNKKEIKELDELSRYFAAYLQFNSFILKNYYINEISFSFSLQLLFIMKHFLLSNYEDFLFTTTQKSDQYAYISELHDITVINEHNLFYIKGININKIRQLDDINISKNFALPISMVFRSVKNSHQKRKRKTQNVCSSLIFYKDGKIERIIEKKGVNKNEFIEKGGYSKMIERYLSDDDRVINVLKNIPIFGELLKTEYFVGEDFSKLFKKFDEIKQNHEELFMNGKELIDELYSKKENIELKREKICQIYYKKLEEEDIIRIGDQEYSKTIIDEYVKNWEIKNSFKKK